MPPGTGISAQLGLAEESYVNEVQQISGTPSGPFGLNFDGALTVTTLATNASAAAIQAALEALPNIGTGGVACAGGPLPTAVTVTFQGGLVSKRNVPALTVQGAVTGLTFTTPTPGTGYGDPVTVTRFLEFVDESMGLDEPRIESRALRSGQRIQRADRFAVNRKGAGGDINFEVASKGFGMLFKQMLGQVTITTPTNGVLTRKHSHTLADPFNKSMTVQIGTPPATGASPIPFTYKGSKVTAWELSSDLDQVLKLKLSLDSQDEDLTIALAAASYATAYEVLYSTGGQMTLAAANFDITKFTLAGTVGLNTGRYFQRANTLKKEPVLGSYTDITGEIDAEFTDLSAYNRFVSGAQAQVVMTWTGSLIETVASPGPYYNRLQITLPSVRFDGKTPDVAGPDVVAQTLPIVVMDDGTNPPITLDYFTTDVAS